jgi:hypothetical protein
MKTILWIFVMLSIAIFGGCKQKTEDQPETSPSLAVIDPATTGSIQGVVSFEGVPPKRAQIDMSQDAGCTIGNPAPNLSEAFLINSGKLENVYVYVKEAANGITHKRFPVPQDAAVLDQKGCRYVPHVLGVMTGQKLKIMNSDPAMHNVHPTPEKNQSWNISQMPKGEPLEKVFDEAELMMPVRCNQHPWMKMFLNVSAHPFFAITGKDGHYEIPGLPPGEYVIAAIHERMGERTATVTLKPKSVASAEFKFSR